MKTKYIQFRREKEILYVKLDRPESRNAFSAEMVEELRKLFATEIPSYNDLVAVVLSGSGTSFCAGADLAWMRSMVDFSLSDNRRDSENLYDMFHAVRLCPVPLIVRVHGHAMGGALGLIAAADIAFAEKQTLFSFSEARLGIAPAVISPFVLEKMHRRAAHRFMLSAEVFSAAQALASGLISEVFPDEDALDTGIANLLLEMQKTSRKAVTATKGLLNQAENHFSDNNLRKTLTELIADLRTGEEAQKRMRNFLAASAKKEKK